MRGAISAATFGMALGLGACGGGDGATSSSDGGASGGDATTDGTSPIDGGTSTAGTSALEGGGSAGGSGTAGSSASGDAQGSDATTVPTDGGATGDASGMGDAANAGDAPPEASDAGDGGGACTAAGVACPSFPTSGYPTDATDVSNCAGFVHRIDCCGARVAMGINHGARTTLCPAEDTCDAEYAPASCSDTSILTDTGETTDDLSLVAVRCVSSGGPSCECETFVCASPPCTGSGPIGSCGP